VKILKKLFGQQQPNQHRLEAEEGERERIYASYRGIKRRLLKTPSHIPLDPNGHFGQPTRVAIALDPESAKDFYRGSTFCPVCGKPTDAENRVAASLEPEFANGFSYLIGVWAHPDCFARCEGTDEQRGIPW